MEVVGESLKDESCAKSHVRLKGVEGEVGVAALEQLYKHQDGDEVHVGGVELEGEGGGADVEDGGHDALHHQGQPHRVVEFWLAGNSKPFISY